MAVLVQFISDNADYLYAACALIALVVLRTAILARRERIESVFSLEREAATNRTYGALRLALLLLLVMAAVYFVSTYLVDAVEPIIAQADPTPTPVFLISTPTPTSAPATEVPTPTITPTPRPRATPRPIPTVELVTPTPLVAAPSCPDSRAQIIEPGVGQVVRGPVQVIGTAQTANFQYYKIEFKPAGAPGDFSFYLRRDGPVANGPLGIWDASPFPPGDYLLRLVTVDITGNFGECTVRVTIGA